MLSVLYYAKDVAVNGSQGVVEVCLRDVRMKEVVRKEWRRCMEVEVKFINVAGDEAKNLSGEAMYQRVEVLRDCWLQLARGLVEERVSEKQ